MRLATLALALALLAAIPAGADFPGKNGRIAFMKLDDAGLWQIWVASRDLSSQAQVTSEPANSGWPVWAPGGSRIAFDTDRADPDPNDSRAINDVFTMNPDGTDLVDLTHSIGFSADAAYSPDGGQIAFDSDRGDYPAKQGIYTMNAADGANVRRVTRLPASATNDLAPRFSPSGRRIAFTRYRRARRHHGEPPVLLSALFVVNVDGTGLARLTSWTLRVGDADWSPSGGRITFETNGVKRGNHPADVYVIDANGSRLRNLTHNSGHTGGRSNFRLEFSSDPVWSPNGAKILFLDGVLRPHHETAGLATINPNGSGRGFVSPRPIVEQHQPDWESTR
jgi:Tol biopolymer transport system component